MALEETLFSVRKETDETLGTDAVSSTSEDGSTESTESAGQFGGSTVGGARLGSSESDPDDSLPGQLGHSRFGADQLDADLLQATYKIVASEVSAAASSVLSAFPFGGPILSAVEKLLGQFRLTTSLVGLFDVTLVEELVGEYRDEVSLQGEFDITVELTGHIER